MVENFRSLHSRLEEIEYLMQQDGLSDLGIAISKQALIRPTKSNA